MNVLLDTNILCRAAQPWHVQHRAAVDAMDAVQRRGDVLCLVPQVLYEFWVVASRPLAANGLGLPVGVVGAELTRLKSVFPLLFDTAAVYSEWERLVTTHQVAGRNAHDARIVAAMAVHGLTHLLTFNTQDFARYPRVTALHPMTVTLPPPTVP